MDWAQKNCAPHSLLKPPVLLDWMLKYMLHPVRLLLKIFIFFQNGSLLVLVQPPWLALTLGTLARDFFRWKITYRFFGPGPVWSLVRPYQLSIKKGDKTSCMETLCSDPSGWTTLGSLQFSQLVSRHLFSMAEWVLMFPQHQHHDAAFSSLERECLRFTYVTRFPEKGVKSFEKVNYCPSNCIGLYIKKSCSAHTFRWLCGKLTAWLFFSFSFFFQCMVSKL